MTAQCVYHSGRLVINADVSGEMRIYLTMRDPGMRLPVNEASLGVICRMLSYHDLRNPQRTVTCDYQLHTWNGASITLALRQVEAMSTVCQVLRRMRDWEQSIIADNLGAAKSEMLSMLSHVNAYNKESRIRDIENVSTQSVTSVLDQIFQRRDFSLKIVGPTKHVEAETCYGMVANVFMM